MKRCSIVVIIKGPQIKATVSPGQCGSAGRSAVPYLKGCGWIPGQGTYLDCGSHPLSRRKQSVVQVHTGGSQSVLLSVSMFLSLLSL